jgi:hypothetical protein
LIIYSPYPTRFSKQKLNKKGNTKTVHIQHYTGRTAHCLMLHGSLGVNSW